MKRCILTYLIPSLLLFGEIKGLHISLYELGSNGTEHAVVVAEHEIIAFRGHVDISDDPEAELVYFQVMRKTDAEFIYVCHINLKDKCEKGEYFSPECECTKIAENRVEFNVSLKASKYLKGAKIRGAVVRSFDNRQILSRELLFPIIMDKEDLTISFYKVFFTLLGIFIFPVIWSKRESTLQKRTKKEMD